ncbi:MAG: tetratricopeptide repeat protein [Candidatus Omnitrophica bacterium]|nr:tetratricopeptide repeat protein [Candidatus Omnitrophota bacterium]
MKTRGVILFLAAAAGVLAARPAFCEIQEDEAFAFEQKIDVKAQAREARALLAETQLSGGEYGKAIRTYQEILTEEPENLEAKNKLAILCAYTRRYDESLRLYDEILEKKEEPGIRLQKARILSWARRYEASEAEYKKILGESPDKKVERELEAKQFYWRRQGIRAMGAYEALVKEDPENFEARFDLGELYAGHSMWPEAKSEYEKILKTLPRHVQAQEGLEKAKLVSERPAWTSGAYFLEARSRSRQSDVHRGVFFNALRVPVDDQLTLGVRDEVGRRFFSDFRRITENENRIWFSYADAPRYRLDAFFAAVTANRDVPSRDLFGVSLEKRLSDAATVLFSYGHNRLDNAGGVIRKGLTGDDFKVRLEGRAGQRLEWGVDYLFSKISDDNEKQSPGWDATYFFSFEPSRVSLTYRSASLGFDDRVPDYFSPSGLWTHSLALAWRQYWNREELHFGAKDLYTEIRYEGSLDSQDIVGHHLMAEIHWELDRDFYWSLRGTLTRASADVYHDKSVELLMDKIF